MGLERLYVSVGGDVSGLEKAFADVGKNIEEVGKRIEGFGKTLSKSLTAPIVAAGASIVGLATASGAYADRILDLTDITGMSAGAIQEWQVVADRAGTSTEVVTSAVEGLVKRMPQIKNESGPAAEAVKKLGLSFGELENLSPDDLIETLVYQLSGLEDPIERNVIASNLFGGAWKDLAPILGTGADKIKEIRDASRDGLLSDDQIKNANEFRESMGEVFRVLKSLTLQIGAELAPVLNDTLIPILKENIIPAIQDVVSTIIQWIEIFGNLPEGVQVAVFAIGGLVAALGPALVILGKVIAVVGSVVAAFAPFVATLIVIATGPLVLIAAKIAAVIAVGWLLKDVFAELLTFGLDLAKALGGFLLSAWDGFASGVSTAIGVVLSVVSALATGFMAGVNWVMSILKKAGEVISKFISSVMKGVREGFSRIGKAMVAPFAAAAKRISDISSRARAALNRLNPFQRESPSLVDNVKAGVKEIKGQYSLIAEMKIERPDLNLSEDTIQAVGSDSTRDTVDAGDLNLLILDDVALRKLQRALARSELDESLRLAGV